MKKVKHSIKINLLILTLLPITLLSAILTTFAAEKLKSTMVDDIKSSLKSTVYSIMSTYCYGSSDKISLDGENLKIGDALVADNTSVVDTIKNLTDTDVTIFQKDTRVLSSIMDESGNRIVGTKAHENIVEAVINNGEDYFNEETEIQGENFCAYYTPLKDANGNIVGMVFAGKPTAEIESTKLSSTLFLAGIGFIIVILAGIVVFIKANSIAKALKSASSYLLNISTGDLTQNPSEKDKARKDEIGLLFNASHDLCENFKKIISKIHDVSDFLISHSKELYEQSTNCLNNTSSVNFAMNDISTGAVSQAEHTKDASDKITDIGNLIKDITLSVDSLNNNSSEIQNAEQEANYIIKDSHEYNEVTIDAVKKIGIQADKTNEAAQKINAAIELITDIAEQTNLLSLNASIEAARAGEAGKGFAVVAEEIQKLADESTNSAQTIKDTIAELLIESDNTVDTMKEVENAVNNQKIKINETHNKFNLVSEGIIDSIENITLINDKAINLEKNKDEIITLLESLSSISEENAASTEETTAAVSELSSTIETIADATDKLTQLAQGLEDSIVVFKI